MRRVPGCKITISVGIFSMPSLHHTTDFYKRPLYKNSEQKANEAKPLL